jgi:hypothetical protein
LAPATFVRKSLLLSAGAALAIATTAQAADLPVKAKPVEYVRVCVTGETTPFGTDLIAYTFNFGNGWSASLSAENPQGHKTRRRSSMGRRPPPDCTVTNDSVATRPPDVVANIRLDQT